MSNDVNKFQFRLVLLGSNGTGFLFKKFETKYKPTVEDLFSKDFDLGAIEIKVDFLDTSGSMQFPAMRRLSITTGNAFLIVYSVDDQSSFEVLKMCVSEIQEARPTDFHEVPIVFVGNKCDIPKDKRKVTKEQVSNYVYYELPRLRTKVIECSCRDNFNIDAIFKAYLSLAKVKLSITSDTPPPSKPLLGFGRGGSGSGKKRLSIQTANQNQFDTDNQEGCQSGANPSVPSNGRTRDNNNNSSNNNNNNNNNGSHCFARRPGSTRVALGVRKSCDASIVSSMRKVSLEAAASKGARDQLSSKNNPQQRDDSQQTTTTTPTSTSTTTTVTAGSTPTTVTTEVVLRDAMWAGPKSTTSHGVFSFGRSGSHSNSGNRLSVDHGLAKPRSRSLIWRPSRKSSRGSTCNDSSECSIT